MPAITLALVGGHTATAIVGDDEAMQLRATLTDLWTSPEPAGVLTFRDYPELLISARDVVMVEIKPD